MTNHIRASAFGALLLGAITGCGGGGSSAPHTRAWGAPVLLETSGEGHARSPQIAFDGSGNAIAVWFQWVGGHNSLFANRYSPDSGWGTAVLVENDDAGNATNPSLSVDSAGNAVVVWVHSGAAGNRVWCNRFSPGVGWGAAQAIDSDSGNASEPRVAMDSKGNAIAVWSLHDGTRNNVVAARYTDTGWSKAAAIEAAVGEASLPRIAVDADGNAIVVWYQNDNGRFNIWTNRHTAGSGWGEAALLETDDSGNAVNPQIAFDGTGNALAAWSQWDGSRFNVLTKRYVPGTGWDTNTIQVSNGSGEASDLEIAANARGDLLTVWIENDGPSLRLSSNRFTPGVGWGGAEPVDANSSLSQASIPRVAMAPSGEAVAVWLYDDGSGASLRFNRHTASTGWGTAEFIQQCGCRQTAPWIAVDRDGNAIAVWEVIENNIRNIVASRFE